MKSKTFSLALAFACLLIATGSVMAQQVNYPPWPVNSENIPPVSADDVGAAQYGSSGITATPGQDADDIDPGMPGVRRGGVIVGRNFSQAVEADGKPWKKPNLWRYTVTYLFTYYPGSNYPGRHDPVHGKRSGEPGRWHCVIIVWWVRGDTSEMMRGYTGVGDSPFAAVEDCGNIGDGKGGFNVAPYPQPPKPK